MSKTSEWRVSRWNSHNEDSVVVDDDQSFSGLRLIAECDTPETARLIAAAPELAKALRAVLPELRQYLGKILLDNDRNSAAQCIAYDLLDEKIAAAKDALEKAGVQS